MGSAASIQRSNLTSIGVLLLFLAICYGVAFSGAIVSPGMASSDWYNALNKPSWTPPNWLFGPVWSALYTLMGIAMWLVWRKATWVDAPEAYMLFAAQLALNAGWSWLFFYYKALGWATFEIVLLLGAIIATIWYFNRISIWAASLLIPYFLWVTYAAILCATIWWIN